MAQTLNVGIHGIGAYLPETTRENGWWPASTVATWQERVRIMLARSEAASTAAGPPAQGAVLAAMAEVASDPFQGARRRHVMPAGMLPSEMEVAAAKEAMERSGTRASEIDFLLVYSLVPDYLTTPNACAVHKQLGLRSDCLSISIDAACNAFMLQLALAVQMIKAGGYQRGLLIQSNNILSLIPTDEPQSAWFGDGATAAVVGRVGHRRGILARSDRTDGTLHAGMVSSVPGRRWFEDGRVLWYAHDRLAARKMLLAIPERARDVIHDSLRQADLTVDDVNFYACHQPTAWLRKVTQEFAGLRNATSVDTFAWAGSLSACNVPLVLYAAQRDQLLRDDDIVAMFSGGSGETWSGIVARWGT